MDTATQAQGRPACVVFLYQLGVPPADIASGRIAEVRRRSMSCNCMTRTSQQECPGILEIHTIGNYFVMLL